MFTEASTPSKSAPQPGTSKADLIAETKAMVISTDNTLRQIADNLASLRDGHHMSQREIAAAVGNEFAWVNRLLSSREEGFSEDTPSEEKNAARGKVFSALNTGRLSQRSSSLATARR